MSVFRYTLVILFTLLCALEARAQPSASPKAVLSPRLYQILRGEDKVAPIDRMLDQLDRISARIDSIQQSQAGQIERQRVLAEQITGMAEIARQVTANNERLNSLERRLAHHEETSINDPRDLAILETKMDAIAAMTIWGLRGMGGLILGLIVYFVKRQLAALMASPHLAPKPASSRIL